MRRHRYRLLAGLGLFAVLVALGYFFWPSPPASPWDRASAVQVGDTRSQLYATLGGPPGDYRRNERAGLPSWESNEELARTRPEMWMSDGGMLYIWLDSDDRVTRVHGQPSVLVPGLLKKIQWKLGL